MSWNKKKKNIDKIVVNHMVFLTREQRYKLYEFEEVEATGLLTQYRIIRGKYGVKHDEVITKYIITTDVKENFVEVFPTHYQINLPLGEMKSGDGSATSVVDLADIVDRKDGGIASICFDAIYTSDDINLQGFHKIVIKDIKEFTKSLSFVDF